jgi:hypothetical protein
MLALKLGRDPLSEGFRHFVSSMPAPVASGWSGCRVGPIVGATKLHHLDDALASVAVKLTAEEIAALEEPYVPHSVISLDYSGEMLWLEDPIDVGPPVGEGTVAFVMISAAMKSMDPALEEKR